jgi:hypothetical protein
MQKSFLIFLCFISLTISSLAQSYKDTKNVVSISLIDPFLKSNSYSLGYEHTLDKGYSPNVSQLSYKIIGSLINDSDKRLLNTFRGVEIFDNNAVEYSGFKFLAELRYYFQWNAPEGYYFTVFGGFAQQNEVFTDRRENSSLGYDLLSTDISRGLGFGVQYKLSNILSMDVLAGYNVSSVSQSRLIIETNEKIEIDPINKDGLRINVSIGLIF